MRDHGPTLLIPNFGYSRFKSINPISRSTSCSVLTGRPAPVVISYGRGAVRVAIAAYSCNVHFTVHKKP